MAQIVDLAKAVVAAANAHTFSKKFVARRTYIPKRDLSRILEDVKLSGLTVIVGHDSDLATEADRGGFAIHDLTVDIGIAQRVTVAPEDLETCDSLTQLAQEIGDYFNANQLPNMRDYTCTGVKTIIVGQQLLNENGVFATVVSLTYKTGR